MSITESIGFGWVVLSTGVFTAFSLIVLVYSMVVGIKTVMGWIETGRKAEEQQEHEREFKRIINS